MPYKMNHGNADKFCRLLAAHWKMRDPQMVHVLLRNLKSCEQRNRTTNLEMQFVRFCRKLVQLRCYDVVLWFVHAVFQHSEYYDLPQLQKLLAQIPVAEGYDLSMLCQDYALNMHNADPWQEPITGPVDLYQQIPAGMSVHIGDYPLARRVLALTLMDKVYGMDVPDARILGEENLQLTKAQIDYIADFVLQHGQRDGSDPAEELPGAMQTFLMVTELEVDIPLSCYILQTYSLPPLTDVNWADGELEKQEERSILSYILYMYAEYLESILNRQIPTLYRIYMDEEYVQQVFSREALGRGNDRDFHFVIPGLLEFCKDHSLLCTQWVNLMQRAGKPLQKAMQEAGRGTAYSQHILSTAFLLYFCGYVEASAQFLLKHSGELDAYARRRPHYLILLTRCVMTVSRLDTANAVYGLFCYELDRGVREQATMTDQMVQMVRFIRDAEDWINRNPNYSLFDHLPYHEILFGDGKIMAQVKTAQARLQQAVPVRYEDFRNLQRITEAFCYSGGVRLPLLGIANVDNYDKLPDALSADLRHQGQRLVEAYGDGALYWESLACNDALRNINLHLQNRLFKLQCAQMKENLQRTTALKQALPANATEEEKELLIEQITEIAENLTGMLLASRQGRGDVEQEICLLREDFELTYLGEVVDLMQKLPEQDRRDVQNYLVTSCLVFRMMRIQKDETLDYSAALISMTKALEQVMHHVYTKLQVVCDPSLMPDPLEKDRVREYKERIVATYFDKSLKPRKKLTLRPYVEVLSDDRFYLWAMDKVLDMGKLGNFQDIVLHVRKKPDGTVVETFFNGDRDADRNRLKQALVYVCDHYRNRSAHPNVVTLSEVEECRQLLIDGQKLLWILLAIMQ